MDDADPAADLTPDTQLDSDGSESEKAEPAQPFSDMARQFGQSMDAVIELSQFANEHVAMLDDVRAAVTQTATLRLPHATPQQHEKAVELILAAFAHIEAKAASGAGTVGNDESEADEEPPAPSDEGKPDPWDTLADDLDAVVPDSAAFLQYVWAYLTVRVRPQRVSVMNSSLLTTAVGNFEVLVSAIVREFLRLKPEAIRSDEARYSLAEIEGYESLVEFRAYCAERYAENLLRGGLEDWMEWFGKRLKIELKDVTSDPVSLVEVFQRRHLVVHNGGRVNRLYLNKMSALKNLPSIGDILLVDEEYLRRATDRLQAAGILLQAQVMKRLLPVEGEDHPADDMASSAIYEFLQEGRFAVVTEVASAVEKTIVSDYSRLIVMVNGWIARKKQHGLKAIQSDVEAWQVQALAPRFRLAKLALLDQTDGAHKLAQELVDSGDLSKSEWLSWPLLSEVREYDAALAAGECVETDGAEQVTEPAPEGAP